MRHRRLGLGPDRLARLGSREGQGEREREGAAGLQLGLYEDVAAMLAGQLTRKVETQPGAADVAGLTVLDPLEPVEQARQVLASDADARVDDLQCRDMICR